MSNDGHSPKLAKVEAVVEDVVQLSVTVRSSARQILVMALPKIPLSTLHAPNHFVYRLSTAVARVTRQEPGTALLLS